MNRFQSSSSSSSGEHLSRSTLAAVRGRTSRAAKTRANSRGGTSETCSRQARPSRGREGGQRTRAQWSVVRRACVTCVYPRCVSKGTRVFGRQTLPSPSKFNSAALCTKETEQATLWDATRRRLVTTNNALLYDARTPPLGATPALLSRQSDPSGECQGLTFPLALTLARE